MRKLKNNELKRLSTDEFRKAGKSPFSVVLDNVRSLNNIGSVFRTADAFLVDRIYLCGITATPPHRDIHKTALGATDSVDWEYMSKTALAIEELKRKQNVIVAVEQTEKSRPLDEFVIDPTRRYAFVFGHEVRGVDQDILDRADVSIEIPQYGTKHSFNISVSAGIVLWHVFRQYHALRSPGGGKLI